MLILLLTLFCFLFSRHGEPTISPPKQLVGTKNSNLEKPVKIEMSKLPGYFALVNDHIGSDRWNIRPVSIRKYIDSIRGQQFQPAMLVYWSVTISWKPSPETNIFRPPKKKFKVRRMNFLRGFRPIFKGLLVFRGCTSCNFFEQNHCLMSLMCTSGCCESLATWETERTRWWLDPKIIPFVETPFTSRGILYIFGCLERAALIIIHDTNHLSHEKNPYHFPLYWLVNRDPYNGLL